MSNHANPIGKFLRSSLVSRHRQIRGEPWKARASESKGSVQARAAGITTSGADRVRLQGSGLLPALGRARPWFGNRSVYILMNSLITPKKTTSIGDSRRGCKG